MEGSPVYKEINLLNEQLEGITCYYLLSSRAGYKMNVSLEA